MIFGEKISFQDNVAEIKVVGAPEGFQTNGMQVESWITSLLFVESWMEKIKSPHSRLAIE